VIKLSGVHTSYGPIEALKGVDLEVREGEIVSLIGSNGAGKSTALLTISGVLRPTKGSVSFMGLDITGAPPHRVVSMGISQSPEGRKIFPRLTVRENLEMGAFLKKGGLSAMLDRVYALFPVLKERAGQSGGTLSGGEQQMLAIGRALMSEPKLLLLDEPSLGLAPIIVQKIFKTIREINREGVTVLLVEQNARAALALARRAYVMEGGRITLEGTGSGLLHNDVVRRAYLGGG
jgi:branched-chain amino acid transport system ATP-binding protein